MNQLPDIQTAAKIIIDCIQANAPVPTVAMNIETLGEPDGDDQQQYRIVIEGKVHIDGVILVQKSLEANAV